MPDNTITLITGAALAVSELLALIPGLKANSVFQLVLNVIVAVAHGLRNKEV